MKVIMTGGGTGGHIYPAVAIADKIKSEHPEVEILFVGTNRGMEKDIVPACGYKLKTITVSGFNRKKILENVKTLADLAKGLKEARQIIKEFKPDLVVGTGGYVCGPIVMCAYLKGIKIAIHEQNAFPGVTNKILSRFADRIFISFNDSKRFFKSSKNIVFSGNPLRKSFLVSDPKLIKAKLGIDNDEFVILCFGGSLGAEKINETMIKAIEVLNGLKDIKLYFITGKAHYQGIIDRFKKSGISLSKRIEILEYTNNMAEYINAADLVICRAGALTIAEITACGKPSVLIPSPNVTDNHQFFNAKVVADEGGAILLEEKDLSDESLLHAIVNVKNDPDILKEMGKKSRKIGQVDAAEIIYQNIKSYFK